MNSKNKNILCTCFDVKRSDVSEFLKNPNARIEDLYYW